MSSMTSLGILAVLAFTTVAGYSEPSTQFDKAFVQFLKDNGYSGGSVAAMRQGELIHARGYGWDAADKPVTAHAQFPLSSLAKSLTAVSIMSLVQEGELSLSDTVFGPNGLLSSIPFMNNTKVDERVYDVTVAHLLRHAGGLGAGKHDPMLNPYHLATGDSVPDIAKELGVTSLTPTDVISYVISQPMTFRPGAKVTYSNVGYLALGRVIEAAAGVAYHRYVQKTILDPCGMWSTRLAPPHAKYGVTDELGHDPDPVTSTRDKGQDDLDLSVFDLVDPDQLDAALGWWSNVYDVTRFARCVFHQKRILDKRHLELLRAPLHSSSKREKKWQAAGFTTDASGGVWQTADSMNDDLVMFTNVSHTTEMRGPVDTWVAFLHGQAQADVRGEIRGMLGLLDTRRFSGSPATPLFLFDLSDLHKHSDWEEAEYDGPHYAIRYTLPEHSVTAWVTAARDEGLRVTWMTSHRKHDVTHFLLMAREHRDADFVFEHGLNHRTLLKQKLHLEERGYNLTLLHAYVSHAHHHHGAAHHGGRHRSHAYAALYRRGAYTPDTQMKYGVDHLPEPYEKLVGMYHEQGFWPLSQTVVMQGKDETFSFIFIKKLAAPERTDFRHYYDLPAKRLSKLTMDNARDNFRLSYLNSYDVGDKYRFSAIFSNATSSRGVLEAEQTLARANEMTISNLREGLSPRCVVPYVDDGGEVKVTVYFEEEEGEARFARFVE